MSKKSLKKLYSMDHVSESTMMKWLGTAVIAVLIFVSGVISGRAFDIGLGDFQVSDLWDGSVNVTGDKQGIGIIEDIDFDLYWTIWNTLEERFVTEEDVQEDKLFYDSIKGMVGSLGDPHTIFLDPDETEAFNDSNAGNYFSGIGAELGYEDGEIIVIAPLKGSPAIKAGIRPGDRITGVDGEPFGSDETIFDAVFKIRGEKGTTVTLTVVHRGDESPSEIPIVRDEITVPSMDFVYNEQEDVAIIEISRFTEASLSAWQSKWDKMVEATIDSGAKGLVIDLRGNPGGYMDAAIYAAGDFLEEGSVALQQEDRDGHVREHKILREGRLLKMPVVLLVNEASASASEILAGALQKNDRAMVVGVESFGKGTAQEVLDFTDGSSIHITVIKWLLPDGTWISEENKIVPDKVVELTDEDFKAGSDPQLDGALSEF